MEHRCYAKSGNNILYNMSVGNEKYKYSQLIPWRIFEDIQEIENHVKPKIKGYKREYLFEVISLVASKIRKEENGDESGQLQIKYLKDLVPQGHLYLYELIDLGIIIRTGRYLVGDRSFSYKFSENFNGKYKRIELSNMKLLRRIEKVHQSSRQKLKSSTRGRSEQIKNLRKLKIEDAVFDEIERLYPDGENQKYNYALSVAVGIKNGAIRYNVDKTSQRFHSNVTNLPSALVPFLRIDGKELSEVDIKNSQPFLSSILFTNPSKFSFLADEEFAMILQSLQVNVSEDVMRYLSLVTSGHIYEFVQDEAVKYNLVLDRDSAKSHVFRFLFGAIYTPKQHEKKSVNEIFYNNFPTVCSVLTQLKKCHYKSLAIFLQRIESYLMLEIIGKRIDSEIGVFLTKHDSILLTDNVEGAKKIVNEVFSDFLSITPKLKVKKG